MEVKVRLAMLMIRLVLMTVLVVVMNYLVVYVASCGAELMIGSNCVVFWRLEVWTVMW